MVAESEAMKCPAHWHSLQRRIMRRLEEKVVAMTAGMTPGPKSAADPPVTRGVKADVMILVAAA